jgi:predicted DNA binding CopG/RHH family protein
MNDGIERKPLPDFASDQDAEDFVEHADLSDYDLSGFKTMRFHFAPSEETVTIRLPAPLLSALKAKAVSTGLSYDRLVEQALTAALHD